MKKKTSDVRKQTEHKAFELARDIVGEQLSVQELENLVSEHAHENPKFKKLLATLYPAYPKISKAFSAGCPGELQDLHWQEVNAYGFAAFHLGFAAAMRLATAEKLRKKQE